MKTTYFNTVIQRTTDTHSIMVSVIPNDMLGEELPTICEVQSFMLPKTIYTGTYPQIKINIDTIKEREDLIGEGINGILNKPIWYTKVDNKKDTLNISI